MGNALTGGDGLTIAEMSVMESYYSIGMTSDSMARTNTDDVSASVATPGPPRNVQLEETDTRDSGTGGGGRNTSSKSIGRRASTTSFNRASAISSTNRGSTTAPSRYETREDYLQPSEEEQPRRKLPPRRLSTTDTAQAYMQPTAEEEKRLRMEQQEYLRRQMRYDTTPEEPTDAEQHLRRPPPPRRYEMAEEYMELTKEDHFHRFPSSPRRYNTEQGFLQSSESRTETSSAYHHGYRMRNDGRDEYREGIEFRHDEGHHGFEHGLIFHNSNKSPQNASSSHYSPNSGNPIKSSNRIQSNNGTMHSSAHLYRSSNDLKSSHSPICPRRPHNKMDSAQDAVAAEGEVLTVADIPPAETDMAYAGSEDDEIEAQAIREKEIASHDRQSSDAPSQHISQQKQRRAQSPPIVVEDASESLQHKERVQLLGSQEDENLLWQKQGAAQLLRQEELRESQQRIFMRGEAEAEDFVLQQQQAAAQMLLQRETMRGSECTKDKSDLPWQKQEEAQLMMHEESQRKSGEESLLRHQKAHQLLHGDSTALRSDSFSTLTKTLFEEEQPLVKQKESEQRHKPPSHTPLEVAPLIIQPPSKGAEEVVEDGDNPAQKKLEELLQQQELQEEKLQKQLEQLRVQKERLQQLQEEKHQSMTPKCSQESHKMEIHHMEIHQHHEGSLHARNEELRIQKERMRAVKVDPSVEGSSHYFRNTIEAVRQEQTRRQRLERARQKVMPKSPKKSAAAGGKETTPSKGTKSIPSKKGGGNTHHSERNSHTTSSGTGTATGEMDVSFPEYEDVPTHFRINNDAHNDNDMTTLSASLTEYGARYDSSTVSSMKDAPVLDDEEDFDALQDAMSSMDEEIDLVFVAKYDKAFNAFLDTYPALFDKDSELVQNLKVAKLQRILEVSYQTECELEAELETPSEAKKNVQAEFQQKLKEASRQKAERTIQLKAELNHAKRQSKAAEAKLTWDMLLLSANRAKKLHKIKADLNRQNDLTSRHDLLASLPDTSLMREVIKSVEAKPGGVFGERQKKQLQQCQVDNAFLNAEVKVLQQRIATLRTNAGRQESLDRVLVEMDSKKLKKLKSRFQKKLGF